MGSPVSKSASISTERSQSVFSTVILVTVLPHFRQSQMRNIPLITPPSGTPLRGSSAAIEDVMTTFLMLSTFAASFKIPTVPLIAGTKISSLFVDFARGEAR